MISTINWLFESRQEAVLSAAIVKTSIALESLLIFNESEPPGRSLSERAAFILSPNKDERYKISRIVKKFYNIRSRVVHGSSKKAEKSPSNLSEGMDRLTLLLCLVIASNSDEWNSEGYLSRWCEEQRWGAPASDINIPFTGTYLRNAIKLCFKDSTF